MLRQRHELGKTEPMHARTAGNQERSILHQRVDL